MPCNGTKIYDGCPPGKQKMFGNCVPCLNTQNNPTMSQTTAPTTMEETAKKNGFFQGMNLNNTLETSANAFATIFGAIKGNRPQGYNPNLPAGQQQTMYPQQPEKDNTIMYILGGVVVFGFMLFGLAKMRGKK